MKDEIRCTVEYLADRERNSPGRIVGTLMEYGTRARSRPEMFSSGALHWPDGDRAILLNVSHDRKQPLMRIVPEDREGAVVVDAPLPNTQRGRDSALLVRLGTLKGLSVEFISEDEEYQGDVRIIKRARLTAAALVDDGDYGSVELRGRGDRDGQRVRRWL